MILTVLSVQKALFSLALTACLFLYTFYSSSSTKSQNSWIYVAHNEARENRQRNGTARRPLILTWNRFFEEPSTLQWFFSQFDPGQCPFECDYSDNRALEASASVTLFHLANPIGPLPTRRLPDQLYTFFLLESPQNEKAKYYDGLSADFFNLTMTYRADSDVPFPYDQFDELDPERHQDAWTEQEILDKVSAKRDLALQLVSNCKTPSRREDFVEQLRQHMDITQRGRCGGGWNWLSALLFPCDAECGHQLMDSHFFYLAFENSVCLNYATEKFWNLRRLIVPVVLSRGVFAGTNVPSEAYIAADDFANAQQLAQHLHTVAANRTRYLEYFAWTRKFKRQEHRHEVLNPLCLLCRAAVQRVHRTVDDIHRFWEEEAQCLDGFTQRRP